MQIRNWALAALLSSGAIAGRTFSTVKGFFAQDDSGTDSSSYDPINNNFGLKPFHHKPSNVTDWQYFAQQVDYMNQKAESNTCYKVIFVARHGEGVHNVAEEYYGAVEWYGYWAERNGNGTAVWMDAHLTPNGEVEAQRLGQAWQAQVNFEHTPAPQSYYTSPLDRCCDTARNTFAHISMPSYAAPFEPTIKEKLRETLGVVTEDERSNKTYIVSRFPGYTFEDGFSEDDELWKWYELELPWQQDARLRELMEDVFDSDDNTYLSFSTHQASAESILRVIGHRSFVLNTVGMLPVLVKSVEW